MVWNLTKTEKDKAQVTIYGPIKDFSSFFSGGVSPQKVMQDLDELANAKEITVRINSGGGSAFAGLAIFELLRAHGAKIITRNDGLAASAASIILMAGDEIIMGTGSMVMAHNPWTEVRGESKDLRQAADLLDRVGESLINVYTSRTKKSREELKAMMDNTTWMTAEEAVSAGFADKIDQKFTVAAAYIHGDSAVVNDQQFSLGIFSMAPPLPVASTPPKPTTPKEPEEPPIAPYSTPNSQNHEEDEPVKDLSELQAKHPEIYQAAIQAGAEQERVRIKSIDEIAATVSDELVAKAKYDTPISAAELALQALKADAGKGTKHIADRTSELEPNADVKPGAQSSDEEKKQQEAANIDMIAAAANQIHGRKEAN
jgi:ATP-dependent Clp protease, protease subunit